MNTIDPEKAVGFLNSLPMCMISLNPDDLQPIACNEMFEHEMGPFYKFADMDFCYSASDDKDSDARVRLRKALTNAANSNMEEKRIRVRNVEMQTVTNKNAGFPIRKFFDWFIQRAEDGSLLLLGDPCMDADVTQRERDAELIDFFNNAPIALHWLSGEGKILWANQTELNVLGYTAEEYIGQDIMKFCPDEEEIVLEIFKQLGSGNAIKEVPVRFRAKDGKIVYLLIDSNVRYEKDGSFGHTRCFIRDDTGRKIRESRASLLLEETKRSLGMLDNFMARALNQIRTPLHVTQNMVDVINKYFKTRIEVGDKETADCKAMVKLASEQIMQSVSFLEDIADLAKFDQGAVLHVTPELVELDKFGKDILNDMPHPKKGVRAVLDLRQGDLGQDGPALAVTDPTVLRRLLLHLLKNAIQVTDSGTIALGIGYSEGSNRLTFSVTDTGPGLEMPEDAAEGDLPLIFQRYHQEFLPEEDAKPNLKIVSATRDKIEESINSHKKTGMGVGLSLTYHLVQALGGEIRCSSTMGEGTTFHFSLPRKVSHNTSIPPNTSLLSMQLNKLPPVPSKELEDDFDTDFEDKFDKIDQMKEDEFTMASSEFTSTVSSSDISSLGTEGFGTEDSARSIKRSRNDIPAYFDMPLEIIPEVPSNQLAACGVKSEDPPSILIVEDTHACGRMICRILSRFRCATKWVENGQAAVDILKATTPGTYDLVLMDLRMPVMDGFEATRIIKHELRMTMPIVALTGDDTERTRKEATTLGFDGFYGKPMKRDELMEVVKEFTGYEVMY